MHDPLYPAWVVLVTLKMRKLIVGCKQASLILTYTNRTHILPISMFGSGSRHCSCVSISCHVQLCLITPMVFSSANKRKHSETPPVARQVGSGIYHASCLEKARTAIMEHLGRWIPEVPMEFMLDHILPPVRCDYVVVKHKLKNSKCIHNN